MLKQSMLILFIFNFLVLSAQEQSENLLNIINVSPKQYKLQNIEAVVTSEAIICHIKAGEGGSIVFFPEDKYWDLTEWVFLSIDIENKSSQEIRFEPIIAYDNPRRGKTFYPVNNKHIGFLKANETLTYNCVMIRDKINAPDYPQYADFPQMKGMPEGVILNYAGIDARHIKALEITFPIQDFERKVRLKRLYKNKAALPHLYKNDKAAFFPFINKYGQYKHGNWPGKITNDSQFEEAIKKEKEDLKQYPGSKEWNQFGGFANGPKFEATGHFRTQKVSGRWWIIDPEGCLFWSTGVNSAGRLEIPTPTKGREHFFEGIPQKESGNKMLFARNEYKHGLANLYRKYGEHSEAKYVATSLKRMKSWGLNTLGGWSAETIGEYPEEIKLPYTVYINSVFPGINEKLPDVFDSRWKAELEQKIMDKASFVKDDPYFFGFFINNEIHWGNPNSLVIYSLEKGADCVGKKIYINLLQQELKHISSFNEMTGASFKSWDELLTSKVKAGAIKVAGLKEYNIKHYTNMCEVYFKTTKELIDKYAPNKMYIGCRWHGNHKNYINTSIAAKYLDILSFNAYENEVEFYPYPAKDIDKPFIISEFNFGALDAGKFFTGLGYASSQRNRGEKYQNFVEGAMRNPRCVGTHWFMWANSTTAGRGNGENANCGLVSMTDQIYYELISYIRKTTYEMYRYRSEID
ncbi:hypothetical protein KDU71_11385 [Carboxylicivirga sediminis]|uniref:Glycoside hydrolase family 42 N-terminal domain-containing protein n=1 Tax=Carboxylicivirga sediminis TaxID=2006564 RepID=A0A941F4B8_9BACT|nr:hypothetical protein [Carboxylicivirga sediminis]MBR8536162.1 hypothetical protein [Carboxylicivirga sediminis]